MTVEFLAHVAEHTPWWLGWAYLIPGALILPWAIKELAE